jgi:hypothetical protein
MSIGSQEQEYELKRLGEVLEQVNRQLVEKRESTEKFRKDVISARKSMWDDVSAPPINACGWRRSGHLSNG